MASSNFFVRLIRNLWRVINGVRIVFLNLLFFGLLFWFIGSISNTAPMVIEKGSALVISPQGRVVEQYTQSPVDFAMSEALGDSVPETRQWDILRAIAYAAEDERINMLVLDASSLWSIGLAQLQELAQAVDQFKTSGKPVIGLGHSMAQHQYYLASLADEVWLDPDGLVVLEGYGRFRNYYQQALGMLGVDVHLYRAGEYKSAAEGYIRTDMSAEARSDTERWLNDLWAMYVESIAQRRGLTAAQVTTYANDYAKLLPQHASTAELALDYGIVDRLLTEPEMWETLAEKGSQTSKGDLRQVSMHDYLAVRTAYPVVNRDKVAVVVAQGSILPGDQSPGDTGGESTARLIETALQDPATKAIVLRVDSPGGAIYPSEKIRRKLAEARDQNIPIVVSMGSVAASGGYWISMASDQVFTNQATITGSIGVYSLLMSFPQTLDKVGINTDGVATATLAGAFRPDMGISDEAGNIIQQIVNHNYQSFLTLVAQARQLEVDQVDAIARGQVHSGRQALELSLVDQSGTLQDAIVTAAELANIDKYESILIETQMTAFEAFIVNLSTSALAWVDFSQYNPAFSQLPLLSTLVEDMQRLIQTDARSGVYAWCLCEARSR